MNWLIGQKVELRPVEPEDLELLLKWENDRDQWEVSSTIAPYSRAIMKDYVDNAHLTIYQTGQLRMIIEEKKDEVAIGTADLFDFDPFHQRVGVGLLIAEPAYRNQGLAGETLTLLQEYCFKHLDLNQLYSNIITDNSYSLQLFEKAGFKISGRKARWIRRGEEYKDELFLQCLRAAKDTER